MISLVMEKANMLLFVWFLRLLINQTGGGQTVDTVALMKLSGRLEGINKKQKKTSNRFTKYIAYDYEQATFFTQPSSTTLAQHDY